MASTFKEKPKTSTGWKTLWFGLLTIFLPLILGVLGNIYRVLFDPVSLTNRSSPPGMASAIFSIFIAPIAIMMGIRALKMGERSWAVWLGLVPALVAALFWIVMITGEILFPH